MPATRLSSVLLPEPLAPMSETNSPSSTTSEASSRGVIRCSPLMNDLVTDSTCNNDISVVPRWRFGLLVQILAQPVVFTRDPNAIALLETFSAGDNESIANGEAAGHLDQ